MFSGFGMFSGTRERVISSLRVEHPFLSFLSDGGPAGQSGAVSVYKGSRGRGRSRGTVTAPGRAEVVPEPGAGPSVVAATRPLE